jgi:hypothetical protein
MRNLIYYLVISLFLVGCSKSYHGDLIFVEPGPEDSFKFPYFLFIPNKAIQHEKVFLIIESNNSGFVDDDLQKHIEKAERTAVSDFYLGNYVAHEMKYPLLVPVFPRLKSQSKIYTHSLDRDVMLQKNSPLERLDLQLIEMVKDAQVKLTTRNILIQPKFLLTGFSASGTFANRFTIIHPDKVFAVAAGGLNGLLMLPLDTLNNEALNYPIGTNDLLTLTNKSFSRDLFLNTPQFYFMGKSDDNDAVPFSDAYDEDEREQIYRLLGEKMQPERWNNCIQIYANLNVNATILSFDGVGHEHPETIKREIVTFFTDVINNNQAP